MEKANRVKQVFDKSFYKDKRVLVTGHTGFKGSWLCRVLLLAGATVCGYALLPCDQPSLYEIADIEKTVTPVYGDIRDYDRLLLTFKEFKPEIVIHMAAQPIVRESYKNPRETYEINVMGTVNVLECVRQTESVRSFLNVTTDKVYQNREWEWGYRETEPLDGFDPYSNSKSCSELVTHSYLNSFFRSADAPAISTARAGNVIGGGDFAKDRIIPDCVRAASFGKDIHVRNPYSTRPYQHVLEPVITYLMIAERQYNDKSLAGWYNVGPDECDCVTTGKLVDLFVEAWGHGLKWVNAAEQASPHEANFLKLDCSKLKKNFDWKPVWHIREAVRRTCEWTSVWLNNGDISAEMDRQINAFLCEAKTMLERYEF